MYPCWCSAMTPTIPLWGIASKGVGGRPRGREASAGLLVRYAEDPVDLLGGESLVGLAGGDDQVGGQLHLTEQVGVLERDVELVVLHSWLPESGGRSGLAYRTSYGGRSWVKPARGLPRSNPRSAI